MPKKTAKVVKKTTQKKKKRGRPTKFRPEYCEMIIKYFSKKPTRRVTIPHYNPDGSIKWKDFKIIPRDFPTFEGFAEKIGVDDDTLMRWANPEKKEKYPGFCGAYARAKNMQKKFLMVNGLAGHYNSQFAIFVAKNVTDMRDTKQVDATVNGNLNVTEIDYSEYLEYEADDSS